ncbi:hypothetical protein ACLB2K_023397 [Fragaria x ananassa]
MDLLMKFGGSYYNATELFAGRIYRRHLQEQPPSYPMGPPVVLRNTDSNHSIDETSEWRTFANESGDNDPVCVGSPTNPLLANDSLSTVIAKPNGASGKLISVFVFGVVARYLHRQFTNCKNQGKEEVNLLQVSEGKTKKESARLFYETLVLKTNGYVDVKQDESFGDILLRKLDKWDRTWGDDTVIRDGF